MPQRPRARLGAALSLLLLVAAAAAFARSGVLRDDSVSRSGLVAAYAFDEGRGNVARDASGHGGTARLRNVSWAGGHFGRAIRLDGTGSGIATAAGAPRGLAQGTLDAWVRPAGRVSGVPGLPPGAWRFVAVVADGTRLRTYVDGNVVAQSDAGHAGGTARALGLGANAVWGERFRGEIDNVRIYSRALTATALEADRDTPVGREGPAEAKRPASTAGRAGATAVRTDCMPHPSACGFPDRDTVGVQPGVRLTPVDHSVTLDARGEVYENKLVTGQISVTAPHVTIRNVKLVATDDYYGIITHAGRSDHLLVDHVEIDHRGRLGDGSGGDFYGIAFDDYTARHVFFHDGSDCAGVADNVTIADSLCAVGPDADGDGWPDGGHFSPRNGLDDDPAWCNRGGQHFDGFQSDRGTGIRLVHNTIRNPCSQTSTILMSSNTRPLSHIDIADNLLAGGGYTLYCGGDTDPGHVTDETVTGNRFARTYWRHGGWYGPLAYCARGWADAWSGNVWDDTGRELPQP